MITPAMTTSKSPEPKDGRNFQGLLEDHLPVVRSIVYRMKQKLPDTIEADELHSIGQAAWWQLPRGTNRHSGIPLRVTPPPESGERSWTNFAGRTR
jgi:Sigma-70 region 2